MSTQYGPSNIDPAEWTWLGNFYRGENLETIQVFKYEHDELMQNLGRKLGLESDDLWELMKAVEFHANHGCASCGSRFQYGSVFTKGATEPKPFEKREIVAVGHECASNLFGLTDLSERTKRQAAKARKAAKIRAEFEASVEADPDLKAAFGLLWTGQPVDHPKDGKWLQGSGAGIVRDIRNKGNRYGSISEKQAELVKKIAREHHEYQARKAEKEAERGPVEDIPVTDERMEIMGTVISHRWDESIYGDTHKMLVESETGRWRVWGSVPAKIEDETSGWEYDEDGLPIGSGKELKGSKVRFFAKVEVSSNDSTFGFYKRPTKPEVIEAARTEG